MNFRIEDIAREAEVSTATVSRTINTPEQVRPATRRKVEAVIKRLGYTPNYFAQGLMKKRHDSVGILASYSMNPYIIEIIGAIENVLAQRGIYSYLCNCEDNIELEAKYAQELIRRNIGALFVLETPSLNGKDNYFLFRKFRCPVIIINQHTEPFGINYVVRVDQKPGIQEVFDYAAESRLFPFVHLISPAGAYSYTMKEALFNAWKAERGFSSVQAQLVKPASLWQANREETVWHTCEAVQELLTAPERPRFIFAGNDLMAMGVLASAGKLGLRVPEDLAVAGVDNTLLSRISAPPLSTVDLRMREAGTMAAELYLAVQDRPGDEHPRLQTIPARFCRRASTPDGEKLDKKFS
jgi:DNA-binding LacI/PurR family transcriptional regulator